MGRHSLGSIVALSSDIAARLFVTVMSVAPMAVLICSGLSRNPFSAPSATALSIARDDASTRDSDVVGVMISDVVGVGIDPEPRAIRTPTRATATITVATATTTGIEGERRGPVTQTLGNSMRLCATVSGAAGVVAWGGGCAGVVARCLATAVQRRFCWAVLSSDVASR